MGAARRKEPRSRKDSVGGKTVSRKKDRGPGKSPAKDPQKGPSDEVTAEVLEFIAAIEAFKKQHARPFPTWSEVLRVLQSLGYRKCAPAGEPPAPGGGD